ncbi:MAG: hypothetical protein J6N76_09405, partial [Lachnospiraceae bacterium]|nr:hypothetical protein [Lachnospiraceae bacterium]
MKKKLLGVIMAGVLSAFTLTACGGDTAAEEAPAAEVTEDVEVTEDAAVEGEITFEDIQADYSELVDLYNQVVELYNSEQIEQSDEIEGLLAEAESIMDEMGDLEEG